MDTAILFFTEDLKFQFRNKTQVRAWLIECARSEKKKIGELNYIFCSDAFLKKMNRDFLRHDYYTDVITFPGETESTKIISGEIYISIERVRENAKLYSVSTTRELHRVMIHGMLHLCGYSDKTKAEQKKIRKKEDVMLGKVK